MNYKRENPSLYEVVFSGIQDALSADLGWLDNTFGKAERVQRIINGKRYYEPAWYKSNGDYITLSPTDTLGNYAFFTIGEPQESNWDTWGNTDLQAPFSLIIWANIERIVGDRNTEALKEDILKVLNGRVHPHNYTINRIYERAENVFDSFTLDETDNQFLMHPYVGWRFTGVVKAHTTCTPIQ